METENRQWSREFWLWPFAVLVLTFCFYFNPLAAHGFPFWLQSRGGASAQSHANFDWDSDRLTRNYLVAASAGGPKPAAGLAFLTAQEAKQETAKPYLSNANMQGRLLGWLLGHADPANLFATARLFCAFALSCCLGSFAYWIRREFGWRAGVVVFAGFMVSTGMVMLSISLYWLGFLWLLPMLVSIWGYPGRAGGQQSPAHWILYASALLLTTTIRMLAGFEFASNVTALAIAPVIYHEVANQSSWSLTLRRASGVLAVCVMAFAIALGLTFVAVAEVVGTVGQAIHHMSSRVSTWSQLQDANAAGQIPPQLLAVGKLMLINVVSVCGPVALPAGLVYGPLFGWQVWHLWRLSRASHPGQAAAVSPAAALMQRRLTALSWAAGVAAAGSLSWLVLRFSHIAFHPRYVHFMLFLPWGLFATALAGAMWSARSTLRGERTEVDAATRDGGVEEGSKIGDSSSKVTVF